MRVTLTVVVPGCPCAKWGVRLRRFVNFLLYFGGLFWRFDLITTYLRKKLQSKASYRIQIKLEIFMYYEYQSTEINFRAQFKTPNLKKKIQNNPTVNRTRDLLI